MSRKQDHPGEGPISRRRPYSTPTIESEEIPKAVVLDCNSIDATDKGSGCMSTLPAAT